MLAVDADESVLLTSTVQSKDDDVRTRILRLSQHAEELQDAATLVCRHTHCSARDTKKPRSQRQWQDLLLGIEPGQVLWAEILAGRHHLQPNYTRLQLETMKDLTRQYEGPGQVVIIDYTSVRPQIATRPEQVSDLPPLWQEFVNATSLKLKTVRLCSWGLRHSQTHRPPLGTRYLLTNLSLPQETDECRC